MKQTALSNYSQQNSKNQSIKFLSVNEVAELLGVHPNHVRRLMGKKAIPYFKKRGVGIRFDLSEIKEWMEEGRVEVRDWDDEARRILDR